MADDRDAARNDDPDPWADLESAGGDAAEGGFGIDAFSFDEDAKNPAAEAATGEREAGEREAAGAAAAEGVVLPDPALGEMTAVGDTDSEADIGEHAMIGGSAWDDHEPVAEPVEAAAEQSADSFGLGEFSEASADSAAESLQPGVAAVVAPARAAASRTNRKKKASGIGQVIGIVLGGVMAIPVTLAILIWGFGKDPFGTTKQLPEQLAFLLPAKFQRGGAGGGGLDLGLPDPDTMSVRSPATDPQAPAAEPIAPEADPVVPQPTAADPSAADPSAGESSAGDQRPARTEEFVDPLDVPQPTPSAPFASPAPPPLDTAALDAALAAAEAAADAFRNVGDPDDPARTPLMLDWYKRLASVAEELVLLERTAADTGRALAGPPEGFKALHAGIAGHAGLRTELARLGRMWLTASKRNGDGVVLQVTFDSARRVGPYWSTQATLELPKGKTRQVVLVSRAEPAAVAGDPIVVSGVILGDGVIWAADVRGAAADAAAPF
jgi:hypothetical protein